jgi:hypothetical protein
MSYFIFKHLAVTGCRQIFFTSVLRHACLRSADAASPPPRTQPPPLFRIYAADLPPPSCHFYFADAASFRQAIFDATPLLYASAHLHCFHAAAFAAARLPPLPPPPYAADCRRHAAAVFIRLCAGDCVLRQAADAALRRCRRFS